MKRVVILALTALIAQPAAGQVQIEREVKRGDWTVFVRRNVWDDRTDALAFSPRAAILGGRGQASLMLGCGAPRSIPALFMVWPTGSSPRVAGARVVFTTRLRAEPQSRVWGIVNGDEGSGETDFLLPSDFWPAARERLEAGGTFTFGEGMPPATTAAVVSLNGFKEALAEMEILCSR